MAHPRRPSPKASRTATWSSQPSLTQAHQPKKSSIPPIPPQMNTAPIKKMSEGRWSDAGNVLGSHVMQILMHQELFRNLFTALLAYGFNSENINNEVL